MEEPTRLDISVRLDPGLRDRLERAAESEDRTLSNLVKKLIREYLDKSYPEKAPEKVTKR